MSDSNVYTAERILAKRKHHGVTQYYIKWKGYSIKESTWEPAENILDRSLLVAFENISKNKASSSSTNHNNSANTSSHNRNAENRSSRNSRKRTESRSSSTSSTTSTSSSLRRNRGRPRKMSYVEQRQEQVRLQRHIELQQQKSHLVHQNKTSNDNNSGSGSNLNNNNSALKPDKKQLVIFNPVGGQTEIEVVEEVVYEPELTKNPVLVTDVTSDDLTVTISECRTPDGFFRT